jgi:hypothetical protein
MNTLLGATRDQRIFPADVVRYICAFLLSRGVVRLSRTCKHYNNYLHDIITKMRMKMPFTSKEIIHYLDTQECYKIVLFCNGKFHRSLLFEGDTIFVHKEIRGLPDLRHSITCSSYEGMIAGPASELDTYNTICLCIM